MTVIGRSLEQDNASVQQRLLFEVCGSLAIRAKAYDRLKPMQR
jgi:hypothetical protein